MKHMRITSPAFDNAQLIPSRHTCDGADTNPPLVIDDVPEDAKSLTLIMDDPDVPKHLRADGMWDHWIVFNISPTTRTIVEDQEPDGVHGLGTSGNVNYHGPGPPDRRHRYFFKLFALDTLLDLPEKSTKAHVERAMRGHIIGIAELVGTYERKKA